MTEEEYFRKNYPDSCYGDKPLSPCWDFFQSGVEFGERQSENKITDLTKQNEELQEKLANADYQLEGRDLEIKELKEGNERLAKHILELQADKGRLTDRVNELEKINAHTLSQLNLDNGELILECAGKDKQLTEAKEIIREMFHYIPSWTGEKRDKPSIYAMPNELKAKAEQFLNNEVKNESKDTVVYENNKNKSKDTIVYENKKPVLTLQKM